MQMVSLAGLLAGWRCISLIMNLVLLELGFLKGLMGPMSMDLALVIGLMRKDSIKKEPSSFAGCWSEYFFSSRRSAREILLVLVTKFPCLVENPYKVFPPHAEGFRQYDLFIFHLAYFHSPSLPPSIRHATQIPNLT